MAVTVSSLAQAVFARATATDAPVFTPGQLLEAMVLGKLPDGMTALRIGDMVISAQLPPGCPAGTALQLQVTSGGATPQLAIVGQPQVPVMPQAAPMPVPVGEMPVLMLAAEVAPKAVAIAPGPTVAPTPLVPAPIEQPRATPLMGMQPQATVAQGAPVRVEAGAPQAPVRMAPIEAVPLPARASGSLPPLNIESAQPVATQIARPESSAPGTPPTPVSPSPAAVGSVAPVPTTLVPQTNPASPAPLLAPATVATTALAPDAPPAAAAGLPPASMPQQSASVSAAPAIASSVTTTSMPGITGAPFAPALTSPMIASAAAPPQTAQPNGPLPSAAIPSGAALQSAAPLMAVATATPAQNAPIVPMTTSAPVPAEAEAASPLLVAQSSARPAASMADMPRAVAQPATPAQAATAPAPPTTAHAALSQMVPEALARQNSMAPLLASLASVVGQSVALPEPVLRAALQMLAQRVALPANGPTGAGLEAAIAKSGIYLEAGLAKGAAQPGDIKAALAGLKGALGAWLGNPAPVQAAQQAAPPLRGMPPRAEMPEPQLLPELPREAGRVLHSQADAALSRIKLMQFASLPDADPVRGPGAELRMEVPFLVGSELVMAQFQIFRDGARQKAERKRGWTMRFAMNFAGAGEVGAEIGLLGKSVSVALWAAEREMAERLNAALPELAPALAALGLDAGAIRVRNLPPEAEKPASGHFVDSVT